MLGQNQVPNITGTLLGGLDNATGEASGAFITDGRGTAGYAGGKNTFFKYSFSASRSTDTYGQSMTVQPSSVYTLMIIKA